MSMLNHLIGQASRSGRRHGRSSEQAPVEQWIWQCDRCPDLTPRPCKTKAEADFLGRQHEVIQHGIALGMSSGTVPHRLGLPDAEPTPLPQRPRTVTR